MVMRMAKYADITPFYEWLEDLMRMDDSKYPDHQTLMFYEIIDKLDSLPEVVRCKDCKHRTVTSDGMVCECALPTKRMQDYYIYGSTILARVEPEAFCSHGERKDNGTV